MLAIYSFLYECIQSVELFFNQLISLKSSEINKLYGKFNWLISLKPDYISYVFKSKGTIMSFSARKLVIHHWKILSLFVIHNYKMKIEDIGW